MLTISGATGLNKAIQKSIKGMVGDGSSSAKVYIKKQIWHNQIKTNNKTSTYNCFIKTMGSNYLWFFLFSYFCKPMSENNLVSYCFLLIYHILPDYGGVIDIFLQIKEPAIVWVAKIYLHCYTYGRKRSQGT